MSLAPGLSTRYFQPKGRQEVSKPSRIHRKERARPSDLIFGLQDNGAGGAAEGRGLYARRGASESYHLFAHRVNRFYYSVYLLVSEQNTRSDLIEWNCAVAP